MDIPRNYHSKWSKSDRRQIYDVAYLQNIKKDTNELIYKTETYRHTNKYGYQRGEGIN